MSLYLDVSELKQKKLGISGARRLNRLATVSVMLAISKLKILVGVSSHCQDFHDFITVFYDYYYILMFDVN